MSRLKKPSEYQERLAKIQALPVQARTLIAMSAIREMVSNGQPFKGRHIRKAFKVSGRQYRKALRHSAVA